MSKVQRWMLQLSWAKQTLTYFRNDWELSTNGNWTKPPPLPENTWKSMPTVECLLICKRRSFCLYFVLVFLKLKLLWGHNVPFLNQELLKLRKCRMAGRQQRCEQNEPHNELAIFNQVLRDHKSGITFQNDEKVS